ncbi:hypothetical protein PR048_022996 [Dryococelus australis]|uniref:DNA-directed RNA polymerase I subunit RPA12 n=1 Tax=Dryococelus australis TaxID=614101 RepID=A0ABQ9GSU5_9NEOP|nr:hypothetical protein PR048_022996 [Dryococelus australis]
MKSQCFSVIFCFSSRCKCILQLLPDEIDFICYLCVEPFVIPVCPVVFGDMRTQYVIHFNSSSELLKLKHNRKAKDKSDVEGPTVERQCPVCKNTTMSYATLQLRSADEGQTVFYTCTKCKFKENENS